MKKIVSTLVVFALVATMINSTLVVPARAVTTSLFKDVSVKHPDYPAMKYLNEIKLLPHYADKTIKPDAKITRVEACWYILTVAPVYVSSTIIERNDFTDVATGTWEHACAQIATEKNIIQPASATTFDPDGAINAAEATEALLRAQQVILAPGSEDYFSFAYQKGILKGSDDISSPLTRGKLFTIVYRSLSQGPIAKVYDGYLTADRDGCYVDPAVVKQVSDEISLLPKEESYDYLVVKSALESEQSGDEIRRSNGGVLTEEVAKKYQSAIDIYPYLPVTTHDLAMYYIIKGEFNVGIKLEEKQRQLNKNTKFSSLGNYGIGRAYLYQNNNDLASQCFKSAISIMPGNQYPYHYLGQILQDQGRHNEAIFVWYKGVTYPETNFSSGNTITLKMVDSFVALGSLNGGMFVGKNIAVYHKNLPHALTLWAADAGTHGDYQLAGHLYTTALEKSFFYFNKVDWDLVSGNLKAVLTSKDADGKYIYGKYAKSTGYYIKALDSIITEQFDEVPTAKQRAAALQNINKALQIIPTESRYLSFKALMLSYNKPLKNYARQIRTLLTAAKKDAFFYDDYYLEGELYYAEKNYKKAQVAYGKVPEYHLRFADSLNRFMQMDCLPQNVQCSYTIK